MCIKIIIPYCTCVQKRRSCNFAFWENGNGRGGQHEPLLLLGAISEKIQSRRWELWSLYSFFFQSTVHANPSSKIFVTLPIFFCQPTVIITYIRSFFRSSFRTKFMSSVMSDCLDTLNAYQSSGKITCDIDTCTSGSIVTLLSKSTTTSCKGCNVISAMQTMTTMWRQ